MTSALKLILFDVDGTLVDSEGTIVSCMNEAFELYEITLDPRDILSIIGLSLPEAVARLAPQLHSDSHSVLISRYKDAFFRARAERGRDHSPLFPGARAVLDALHAVPEYILGVATGKSQRGLDALIEGHDLGMFVTRQVADHHPSKPHPSMVLTAMSETGIAPADTVMIGDTTFDMDMGRAAGVTTIGVDWGYHPAAHLGADHMLAEFAELPDLLRRIWPD